MDENTQVAPGEDHVLNCGVDAAREGLFVLDAQGCILLFNPACEHLFGYRREEVMGRSATLLMRTPYRGGSDGSIESPADRRGATMPGHERENFVGVRKDGSTFPMNVSVALGTRSGEPIGFGVIRDAEGASVPTIAMSLIAQTRRERTEREAVRKQRLESVGRLSGGVAHHFNNILTVILGNADLLAESLGAQEQKQWVEEIIAAAENAASLTQSMLAFGQRQTLRPVKIDCNKLVESMRERLQDAAQGIIVTTHLDPELASTHADPAMLQSVLLTLFLNARDAMSAAGEITITTGNVTFDEGIGPTLAEIRNGAYVTIGVTDNGQGMLPQVRAHAFEPFFTTKEVGQGNGLGLSMVYGFAKQSNGHVTIHSEPGLGTTVRLFLPSLAPTPAAGPPPAGEPTVPGGRSTVLVVEDDDFVRGCAVTSIRSLGYRVMAVVDGDEAMALLAQAEPIDVLFGDMMLSGSMNGWELTQCAKRMQPKIKVLLTSDYTLAALAKRGRIERQANVLTKPYRTAELARRLHETVTGR